MFKCCKGCKKRTTGRNRIDCHNTCSEYQKEVKKNEEFKEKKQKNNALRADVRACRERAIRSVYLSTKG